MRTTTGIRTAATLILWTSLGWAGRFSSNQQGEVLTSPRATAALTRLAFPFVSGLVGYDTEITISNTSQDTFGTASQSGSCTLYYYGNNAPPPRTTPTIAPGKEVLFTVTKGGGGVAAAPDFQGYVLANCGFALARGFAKIMSAGYQVFSQDAQVLNLPWPTTTPTYLLFPFVVNQAAVDTGIAISNMTADPFGTIPVAGACTVSFYGINAPAGFSTGTIAAGSMWVTTASVRAPNFRGYVVATCPFAAVGGIGAVINQGAPVFGHAASPELLTVPRANTFQPLLFPAVSNEAGVDTSINIMNTGLDPLGSTALTDSCTLFFYGTNARAPLATPIILPGQMYTTMLSAVAPGFTGYIVAACAFTHPRGWANSLVNGGTADGDSQSAERLTLPRSGTASALLFSAVTNSNRSDTKFVISNTSQDSFGTAPASGSCTISYFGDTLGGTVPAPQTTPQIAPGTQFSFTLSAGNAALGIAGAPGFHGYVIVNCTFPLARGIATVTGSRIGTPTSSRVGALVNGLWFLDASGDGGYGGPPADRTYSWGWAGTTPLVGDWNGNGKSKSGFFINGFWYLDYDGNGVWDGGAVDKVYQWGWNGVTPITGDWNGDGRKKIGFFINGYWYLDYNGNGIWEGPTIDRVYGWGWDAVTPLIGDWNGDGRDKIGFFVNGFWYLDYDGNGIYEPAKDKLYGWGWNGVKPLVGDWNGSGFSKIGYFINGSWFLDYDGNGLWDGGVVDKYYEFGWNGVTPLIGDWNTDGRDKIGIFIDGTWYLDFNGNGVWNGGATDRQYFFGSPGYTPVVGAW